MITVNYDHSFVPFVCTIVDQSRFMAKPGIALLTRISMHNLRYKSVYEVSTLFETNRNAPQNENHAYLTTKNVYADPLYCLIFSVRKLIFANVF